MSAEAVQVPDDPEPTLRDRFAMAVLPSLMDIGQVPEDFPGQSMSTLARVAYALADAMMEARKK